MSWCFDQASLVADELGGLVYTLRLAGARWFAVVDKGNTTIIAALASENDGETSARRLDRQALDIIIGTFIGDYAALDIAKLERWVKDAGIGEMGCRKFDRRRIDAAIGLLPLASDDDFPWTYRIDEKQISLNVRLADAVCVVMGVNDIAIPSTTWAP